MKRLEKGIVVILAVVLMLGAFVLPVAAAEEKEPEYEVTFYSRGGEVYRLDNAAPVDGEVYMLVWTKADEFGGIQPDGTPYQPETDVVIAMGNYAKDGRCPETRAKITKEQKETGKFYLFLIDTRVEGEPSKVKDGKLSNFGGCTLVYDAEISTGLAQRKNYAVPIVLGCGGLLLAGVIVTGVLVGKKQKKKA